MGLDIGSSKIGIAIADEEVRVAIPFLVLERDNDEATIHILSNLIKEYEVFCVIIGFPKTLQGDIGTQAKKVLFFVDELQNVVEAEIILWDERYTTLEAKKRLRRFYKRSKIKTIIDANAAALILQSYMDWKYSSSKNGDDM